MSASKIISNELFFLIYYNGWACVSIYMFLKMAKEHLQESAKYDEFFPKDYVKPKRWMQKILCTHKKSITIWAYISLYMGILGVILGPIMYLIFLNSNRDFLFGAYLAIYQLAYYSICLCGVRFIIYIKNEIAEKSIHSGKKNNK